MTTLVEYNKLRTDLEQIEINSTIILPLRDYKFLLKELEKYRSLAERYEREVKEICDLPQIHNMPTTWDEVLKIKKKLDEKFK